MPSYARPTPGFVEEVFCAWPMADENGRTVALLHDPAGERGVAVEYPIEQLPCLTLWKSTAAVENGYVTGVEPGTGFPHNRRVERERGRVPVLAPGASRTFVLDVEVQRNPSEVRAALDRIASIQGRGEVLIDERPEGS